VDVVMQWNLLTRERFLAAWVVLFSLAGLYLLGFLRLPGIKPGEEITLGRLFSGMAFLVFSISLLPGIFGGRLGELDAFVPYPTDSATWYRPQGEGGAGSGVWMKNTYPEALAKAREEGKMVLVSFTGYACTNCHWMKANMFTRPEIASVLGKFVLVELYTDGTDAASEQNQNLQQTKFGTVAIPHYAILTPEENIVASFAGLTRSSEEFLSFLNSGTPTVSQLN
jgi:thiol:disulfide interchange protein